MDLSGLIRPRLLPSVSNRRLRSDLLVLCAGLRCPCCCSDLSPHFLGGCSGAASSACSRLGGHAAREPLHYRTVHLFRSDIGGSLRRAPVSTLAAAAPHGLLGKSPHWIRGRMCAGHRLP